MIKPPEDIPPMHDAAFLEISSAEKRALRKPPTQAQIEDLFPRPSFRYYVARIKELANKTVNQFVSGVGIPEGLKEASNREAYFAGLVSGLRLSLNLRREMWNEMYLKEEEEVVQDPVPKAKEISPFTGRAVEKMTEPGE